MLHVSNREQKAAAHKRILRPWGDDHSLEPQSEHYTMGERESTGIEKCQLQTAPPERKEEGSTAAHPQAIEKDGLQADFFVDDVPKVAIYYYVLNNVEEGELVYWGRGESWETVICEAYEKLSGLGVLRKIA